MRIIRSSVLPALVLVKGRGIFTVAVPERLSSGEILELASLVLSTSEYEEFRHAVEPHDDHAEAVGAGHPGRLLGTPSARRGWDPWNPRIPGRVTRGNPTPGLHKSRRDVGASDEEAVTAYRELARARPALSGFTLSSSLVGYCQRSGFHAQIAPRWPGIDLPASLCALYVVIATVSGHKWRS
jgi:hypothetical protein